jgi:hypothetical protein
MNSKHHQPDLEVDFVFEVLGDGEVQRHEGEDAASKEDDDPRAPVAR